MNNYPVLIEIGYEDLPPESVEILTRQSYKIMSALLKNKRIEFNGLNTFVSVRRLTIVIKEIASHQTMLYTKIKGPPYAIACDKEGVPTNAGKGFASKMGVDFKKLIKQDNYLFYVVQKPGEAVRGMLSELLCEFLKSFNFPITMKWSDFDFQFPRPIRHLLVKFGKTSLKIKLGNVQSGRTTRGHYIFANKKITIENIEDYEKILKRNYVIINQNDRMDSLKKAIIRTLKYTNGRPTMKEELLRELNNSIEFPTGIRGKFPAQYLNIPREIIEACLIHHQKYFPVEDKEGNLLNSFVAVRDGISVNLEKIRKGYEKVLISRLNDADFFLNKDRQHSLQYYYEKLKKITLPLNLGTLYDKVQRVENLVATLCKTLNKNENFIGTSRRITQLAKADITTLIVEEFPELEGIIGRIYAIKDGETKKVADGILGQYQPRTSEDKIQCSEEAGVSGIADRIDTLTGNIGKGAEPSGSEDPFGMRRTAKGLIRILTEKKWDININELIEENIKFYLKQKITFKPTAIENIKKFIFSQMKQHLKEIFSYDVLNCVLKEEELNPYITFKKAKAIEKIKKSRGFDSLITAFKRIKNILKQAEEKNIIIPEKYDVKLLKEKAEKDLSVKYNATLLDVSDKLKEKNFYGALKILSSIRGEVGKFFDKVLVMAPEKKLMKNRLAMLKNIVELFFTAGDISKL